MVGEADEGETSWDLDIRAVDGFEARESELKAEEEEIEEESDVGMEGVEEAGSEKPEESEVEIEEPEGERDTY